MRDRARVGRRPILIAGGRALWPRRSRASARHAACAPNCCPGELDIADEASVATALDHFSPWAVVNAAGYVRVDDAEWEEERCRRENTVARSDWLRRADGEDCGCCVSPDLVFDGQARRRYLEGDRAAPLSAYGRSKADADAAVQAACSHVLVARTGAFFGPWDAGQRGATGHRVICCRPAVARSERSARLADLRPGSCECRA